MTKLSNTHCAECGKLFGAHFHATLYPGNNYVYLCPTAVFRATTQPLKPKPTAGTPGNCECGHHPAYHFKSGGCYAPSDSDVLCRCHEYRAAPAAPETAYADDWRRCPDCGQLWPHPSNNPGKFCLPCATSKARAAGRASVEQENAALRRQVDAVRALLQTGQSRGIGVAWTLLAETLDAAAREPAPEATERHGQA